MRGKRLDRGTFFAIVAFAIACGGETNDGTGETTATDATTAPSGPADAGSEGSTDGAPAGSSGSEGSPGADGTAGATEAGSSGSGDEASLQIELLGRYETGIFAEGAAEISAFDPTTQRLFVINGSTDALDVLDLSDPTNPQALRPIAVAGSPTSVDVHDGAVAVALDVVDPITGEHLPGSVQFFDADGEELAAVTVGALPDMLLFTPDGSRLLVANEGEPSDDYLIDPEGSVSIIDLAPGVEMLTDDDVTSVEFGAFAPGDLDDGVRIFGPGASVAQDLEPEYVAVAPDGSTAWVTLQENNALAIVDIAAGEVTSIVGLGFKDHSEAANALDPSDEDGAVAIADWPVLGMYLPDAIAAFEVGGETFIVTAN